MPVPQLFLQLGHRGMRARGKVRALSGTLALLLASFCLIPGYAQDADVLPDFRSRATTRLEGDVRASVAVLSAAESRVEYGASLAKKGIQPVWIQIENRGPRMLWLMSPGIDADFFPPSEVAEAFPGQQREILDRAFRNPVRPGATVSGFVLTHRQEGVKLVQLDLVSTRWSQTLLVMATVPGLRSDYVRSGVFDRSAQAEDPVTDLVTIEGLRAAITALPCCVTNRDGTKPGDPLNLVIIGGLDDAFPALVRRGWSPTESTWSGSVMRMITSSLSRERYAYAPVSNLYLYGRPQDLALQKARDNIHQRNHLRLWKSPMTFRGKPVWVGQVSRDIGSRMTIHSPTLTTHKIDPDVDSAALALTGDMVYSQNLQSMGFASGVGHAPKDAPRRNLTTDPYFTSGLRAVLIFDRKPTPMSDIRILPWDSTMADPVATPGGGVTP